MPAHLIIVSSGQFFGHFAEILSAGCRNVLGRFARMASKLRFASFSPLEARFAKKGVQFGNPQAIRENQAVRANLRIDSRESGHLSQVLRARKAECSGLFWRARVREGGEKKGGDHASSRNARSRFSMEQGAA